MTAEHDAMERPAEMRARVQHLLEEGRAQEAIQLVEDAMHRHPDKPGLAVLAARTALSTGARAKAEQDLTFIIGKRPQLAEAQRLYTQLLLEDGRQDEAWKACCEALTHCPDDAVLLFRHEKLATVRGEFEVACASLWRIATGSAPAPRKLKALRKLASRARGIKAVVGEAFADPAINSSAEMSSEEAVLRAVILHRAGHAAISAQLLGKAQQLGLRPQDRIEVARLHRNLGAFEKSAEMYRKLADEPEHANEARSNLAAIEHHMARSVTDQSRLEVLDFGSSDVIVREQLGADTLVICFSGIGQGALFEGELSPFAVHRLYLRDSLRLLFLAGVKDLARSYQETLTSIRELAVRMGAGRIFCLGGSAGGYAAIRYGIDLGAEGILTFSAPTSLSAADMSRDGRGRLLARRLLGSVPEMCVNLRDMLAAARPGPRVINWYGSEHASDRMQAENLVGLPNVELRCIPRCDEHMVWLKALASGELHNDLADLLRRPH